MSGDACDFFTLLAAVQCEWSDMPVNRRISLNNAAVELGREFLAVLGEVKKDLAIPAVSEYRAMCDRRVVAFGPRVPLADLSSTDQSALTARWTLLRLEEGEPGFHRWNRAKTAFVGVMEEEIVSVPVYGPFGWDVDT